MSGQTETPIVSWRMRNDVEIHPGGDHGDAWVIKDPLKLSYFYIGREEFAFMRLLDGRSTWDCVKQELQTEFSDIEFSDQNLRQFLASGIKSGLLVPNTVGYGEMLARSLQASRRAAVSRKLLSLISHRFRGIDPTGILRPLDRIFGWLFHRQIGIAATCFVSLVTVLVLSRWSQLVVELPSISQLFTPANLIILTITVAGIKVLHELGHALTCYHYGGECHELGCIVVGFLPLLYCDVSDSWLQKNRMRRVQVAAAGIAVELFVAAVFGLLWVASVPGFMHAYFLNAMLLCSLNTVLVNGNPLLRYDGYYVLSDLLSIPNLGPESRSRAIGLLDRIVLGTPCAIEESASFQRRFWMPVFGLASIAYRWIVLATILFVINAALKPMRLEGISYVFVLSVGLGVGLSAFSMTRQRWNVVKGQDGINYRAAAGMAVAVILILAGALWPISFSTNGPFTLSPGVSTPVYVQTAGYINPSVTYGSIVEKGQQLASLSSPEIEIEVARQEGELKVAQARLTHLTGTRQTIHESSTAIPAAQNAVSNATKRLGILRDKAARFLLSSPRPGIVFPPRSRTSRKNRILEQQFWTGLPLDAKNTDAWVEEQTLVAWVGDLQDLRLQLYVEQQDIEFIVADALVAIYSDSRPGKPLCGSVVRVTTTPETSVPPELGAKGMLTSDGSGAPNKTLFAIQVRIDVDESSQLPPVYSTGTASIQCQPRSLLNRLWRMLRHTFAFDV